MEILVTVLAALAVTEIATIATTIYLHRTLAHRSLTLSPAAEFICRLVLWLTTGQRRQEWVAVHRKHHTFTDKKGDPHSPKMHGFWNIQLGNVYYYIKEAKKPFTLEIYAPDLKPDFLERLVFTHGKAGLAVGIGILCYFFGVWQGLAAAATHAVLYVFVVAPLINGLGHWRGQQNFPNTAYNSRFLAWFTAGESLHNNHHAHPRAPKFSMRRGERDPAWPVIKALVVARAAQIVGTTVKV